MGSSERQYNCLQKCSWFISSLNFWTADVGKPCERIFLPICSRLESRLLFESHLISPFPVRCLIIQLVWSRCPTYKIIFPAGWAQSKFLFSCPHAPVLRISLITKNFQLFTAASQIFVETISEYLYAFSLAYFFF